MGERPGALVTAMVGLEVSPIARVLTFLGSRAIIFVVPADEFICGKGGAGCSTIHVSSGMKFLVDRYRLRSQCHPSQPG